MPAKVVFLLGTVDRDSWKTGEPMSEADFVMLDALAHRTSTDLHFVWVTQDSAWAGAKSKPPMAIIRAERPRVLDEIVAIEPTVVVACGPVPLQCLMNKGSVPLKHHQRTDLSIPELEGVTCVASHSLEHIAAKPGLEKMLMLDLMAGLHGMTETKWGRYHVLQPGTPEWSRTPGKLEGRKVVGFDLETFPGLDPFHPDARIRMAVVACNVGEAWLVQARKDSTFPRWLTSMAADPSVLKCGSNIKYDHLWMRRFGYKLENMFDTSTAEHVIDCTNPMTDLKSLTFTYVPKLGDYSRGHRDLVRSRSDSAKDERWDLVEDREMYQYTGGDGEASIGAALGQRKILQQDGLTRPFKLSMELYRTLAEMEFRGACVSLAVNQELNQEFESGLARLRTDIIEVLGPINPNSPDQLAAALKEAVPNIILSTPQLTRQFKDQQYALRKGEDVEDAVSTEKEILEREAHKHPVINTVLLYRRYAKLHGTYVTGVAQKHMVLHPDRQTYVHTRYRTDVVETYRLSSQGPNLQNVPRKPEPDDPHPIPPHLNIKRQFVSRFPGGSILEADLSQAEIRVAAHLSRDPLMMDAIVHGQDIHRAMTAKFLGKKEADVTDLERTHGKRQNFLVIYGGGANTLSRQLGIPKAKAKQMLDQYFDTFHYLREYIDKCGFDVMRSLVSESMFGYRRRFRAPTDWNQWDGWRIKRQAWNHKVQNGAGCVAFVGMNDLELLMRTSKMRSVIVMQVHDSVVIDVYPGEEEQVAFLAKVAMEKPSLERWRVKLTVPLVVDVEIGPSWGEKKKVVS